MTARPPALIVLDDDPTGTQTVYGVPILAAWPVNALRAEFERGEACFYILTNSRALTAADAERINQDIARNLKIAAGNRPFAVVSRSDSTLRGHFPLETDILSRELGPFDGVLLVPFFEAGGRVTIDDVHYVKEESRMIPAAETPFAQDPVFGYTRSNLREWVEEKTRGRVRAVDVLSISLGDLRSARAVDKLRHLTGGQICVVNAEQPADLARFVQALHLVERDGKRFLFRTAAEFVAAWLGLPRRPLLDGAHWSGGAGLMILGSHVPKSSAQLGRLLASRPGIVAVEISVPRLLGDSRADEIARAARALDDSLAAGRDTAVFTSRERIDGGDPSESLRLASSVSSALVDLAARLPLRPRFLIAKGGITSSDLATRGLGVKRAVVQGQILPGVPVWKLGEESRFPGLPYVVFPGNVGGPEALADLWRKLDRSDSPR